MENIVAVTEAFDLIVGTTIEDGEAAETRATILNLISVFNRQLGGVDLRFRAE